MSSFSQKQNIMTSQQRAATVTHLFFLTNSTGHLRILALDHEELGEEKVLAAGVVYQGKVNRPEKHLEWVSLFNLKKKRSVTGTGIFLI
jgi:hypothetical protein